MSAKLKIIGLPADATEPKLRLVLGNKRKYGGGPVKEIQIIEIGDSKSALVTFEESEAVDIILGRGDTIPVGSGTARVERCTDVPEKKPTDSHRRKSSASASCSSAETQPKTAAADTSQKVKKPKKTENNFKKENVSKPMPSDLGDKTLSADMAPLHSAPEKRPKSFKNTPHLNRSESNENSEGCVEDWKRTIKAHLKDITKSKDFYVLYLEDPAVSQGIFDEDTIMMDGLNRILYVTFETKKGAESTVRYQQKYTNSNFTKVEIASEEDFNIFNNLLSVHGHSFGTDAERRQLMNLVEHQTKCKVVDIVQQDEPRSAILVFDQISCPDIIQLTWTNLVYNGTRLIVAPVFQNDSVKLTGLNPNSSDETVKRYMSSHRSGGGSPLKDFKRLSPEEAVVTFTDADACKRVCGKNPHKLEDYDVMIKEYYTCLGPEVYNKQIQSLWTPPSTSQDGINGSPEVTSIIPPSYTFEPLYTSCYLQDTKGVQYFFDLCRFGKQFLLSRNDLMESIMHKTNCKYSFQQQYQTDTLLLQLNWPGKIFIREVKDKLKKGYDALIALLDSVKVAKLKIDEAFIDSFQKYCLGRKQEMPGLELFIDRMDNTAVFISSNDQCLVRSWINSAYQNVLMNERKLDGSNCVQTPLFSGSSVRRNSSTSYSPAGINQTLAHERETNENSNSLNFPLVEEVVILSKKDVFLLQKTSFLNELRLNNKHVEIMFQPDHSKIILKGESAKNTTIHLEILKRTTDFVSLDVSSMFSLEQREFLSRAEVQDRVNHILETKSWAAHLHCVKQEVILYRDSSVDESALKNLVQSQIVTKQKSVDEEFALMLQSEKGRNFLTQLHQISDSRKTGSLIKLDKKCLHITTSSEQLDVIMKEIDRFAEENKSYERQIQFSSGKQAFVAKFSSEEFKKITDSLKDLGASLKKQTDSIFLKGLKDGITMGEIQLKSLSDKIIVSDVKLKYFGIKEFLATRDGKSSLAEIENKTTCIIQQNTGSPLEASKFRSSQSLQQPPATRANPVLAHVSVAGVKVQFMQADITEVTTDVVVNAVDSSLNCQSGLGKTLLKKGGQTIQDELESSEVNPELGNIVITGAGNLEKCRSIFHVICPVFDQTSGTSAVATSKSEIEKALRMCYAKTTDRKFSSIAFPFLGVGKKFQFPVLAICNLLVNTLKRHLEDENSSLKQVVFCDLKLENLSDLVERFKVIFDVDVEDTELARISKLAAPPIPPRKFDSVKVAARNKKDFRHIKVKFVSGKISKEKADVMVVTIGRDLNLSKGGMTRDIAKYGGSEIQDELTNKYESETIQQGDFGTTSGGNLSCKHIFYARLHRYNGTSSEMQKLVYKMLQEAEKLGATSISFPALGTGNFGYPPEVVADTVTDAISQFARDNHHSSLKAVTLVVFPADTSVAEAFQKVLKGDDSGFSKADSGFSKSDSASSFKHSGFRTEKSNEIKYKAVTLKIKKGDITAEKCGAIVSGIKKSLELQSSGAVSKAILQKCGDGIQDECNSKKDEFDNQGFLTTSAPNLNCQLIFHVSMDKFSRSWDSCVFQVLTEAEKQGITSLALPALGTGSKRADHQDIKNKIFSGVEKFSKNNPSNLKDVRLVVYSRELLEEFLSNQDGPHQSPRGISQDKTGRQALGEVSDSVNLKIYSNDHSKSKEAEKELNQLCKDKFKEMKIPDEELKNFDKHKVRQLEETAIKHKVEMEINFDTRVVFIKSFFPEGFAPVVSFVKDLSKEVVEERHKNLHKATKSTIIWQFERGQDKWGDFEPLHNSMIESAYKSKKKNVDITDARKRSYRIDLEAMKENPLDESGGIVGPTISIRRHDRTREGEPLPKKWERMKSDENLKLVTLTAGSPEYKEAEDRFLKGGAAGPIKKIERVQNKSLYQQYKAKKREIDHRNPKGHQNEQTLFHGTDEATVTAINANGFNRSYCGKNATMYGDGVYFATTSSYSVSYARPNPQGIRYMFIVRVLTGQSTPSQSGMKHLPIKPGTNVPYDSGAGPGMFIIYHDSQAYPEYLISF